MEAHDSLSAARNEYGSVEVREGIVPDGLAHVPVPRASITCKSLEIEYAPALVGFNKVRARYFPIYEGVVVRKPDESRLLAALTERDERSKKRAPSRESARARKQQTDTERFAAAIRKQFPSMPEQDVIACAQRATEIGSGRVGRSAKANDPVRLAVLAHARHRYTGYDHFLMQSGDREIAREKVGNKLLSVVQRWERQPKRAKNT